MLGVREQPGHRRLVGDEDTQVVGVRRDEEQRVDGSTGRRERVDRSAAQGCHQRMQVVCVLLGRDRGRRVLAQTPPGVAGIDEHQHPVGQETRQRAEAGAVHGRAEQQQRRPIGSRVGEVADHRVRDGGPRDVEASMGR